MSLEGKPLSEFRRALREEAMVATIFIDNTLNQTLIVQIRGNRVPDYQKSVVMGSVATVSPNTSTYRTLTPNTTGWLPYLTVDLRYTVAPTSGAVSIYRIKGTNDQAVIVSSLAIRDTSTYTPLNTTAIRIVDW